MWDAATTKDADHDGGIMTDSHNAVEFDAQRLWSLTQEYMESQGYLSPRDTRLVNEIHALGLFDNMIILSVNSESTRSILENKLHTDVIECLSAVAGRTMTFVIKVEKPEDAWSQNDQPDPADQTNQADNDTNNKEGTVQAHPNFSPADHAVQDQFLPDLSQEKRQNPQNEFRRNEVDSVKPDRRTYQHAHYGQHAVPTQASLPLSPVSDHIRKNNQGSISAGSAEVSKNLEARNAVTHLNPFATFDTFVQGTSNRFAKSAAVIVAEAPGTADYNPLFIYGGSGLGKTHLLNAIGNYVLQQDPTMTVRYVTAEEFVNDFVSALAAGARKQAALANFTKKYRNVDVLLLDDIQFFRGSETMEQFFHTFNELTSTGKQIVIASDVAPNNLKGFNERLRTRFNKGLVVDVAPPEKETRVAILRLKVSNSNLAVPDDVLDYIADKITDSVRELEGALTRVTAIATLNDQQVTRTLAEQTLHDFFNSDVEVTPTSIITNVAQHYTLTFDDIVGPSRTKNVAEARQVSMYLIREMTSLSLVDIGEIFGGRDHSTVMHACKKVAVEMGKKRTLYNNVNDITMHIKQSNSLN